MKERQLLMATPSMANINTDLLLRELSTAGHSYRNTVLASQKEVAENGTIMIGGATAYPATLLD